VTDNEKSGVAGYLIGAVAAVIVGQDLSLLWEFILVAPFLVGGYVYIKWLDKNKA